MGSKNKNPLPLVLIFGPTAVGKSDFVYSTFGSNYEIINSDSQQVYKHLDIGTAKPKKEILQAIPHHIIDFMDPKKQFHAGEFVRIALDTAREIYARKRIPLIVGGTAFYLKNLVYGLSNAPPSDECIRARLSDECKNKGLFSLFERLVLIDPVYAEKIGSADTMRILRALEVYEMSSMPLSFFEIPNQELDSFSFFLAGLDIERTELYKRIEHRVDLMFEKGLIQELKQLIKMGYSSADPGMKGIGYREFFIMQKDCMTLRMLKELIKRDTRRFAKRQMTFFRSFTGVHWFNPNDRDIFKTVLMKFLSENLPNGFDLRGLFQ